MMCKVCERVNSLIEAMESLYTLEDWKALLIDEGLAEGDDEMSDIILTDDRNVWMNMIAIITATWCFKKKIPLFPGTMTITQHMVSVYQNRGHHSSNNAQDKEPES